MLLPVAAILGFVSVAFGAYSEHGLRPYVSDETFRFLMTAIRYNQVHAVAAIAVALAALTYAGPRAKLLPFVGWAFVAGVVLFSGGIYLYALTGVKEFTFMTPVGGVTFMLGWAGLVAFGALQRASTPTAPRGEIIRGR